LTVASFGPPVTFATGRGPDEIAVGDLNGDGRSDLAVLNRMDSSVSVLLNTTPPGATLPSFAGQRAFYAGGGAGTLDASLAIGDLNGDGKPDLAVINLNTKAVSILLNTTPDGDTVPGFSSPTTLGVGGYPTAVTLADIDEDGRPDLVVTLENSTVAVFLDTTAAGGTAPSFAKAQTFALPYGSIATTVAAADLNADGRPDLCLNDTLENTALVLLNETIEPPTLLLPGTALELGQAVSLLGRDSTTPNWVARKGRASEANVSPFSTGDLTWPPAQADHVYPEVSNLSSGRAVTRVRTRGWTALASEPPLTWLDADALWGRRSLEEGP
jgi:hypothetical protein